MLKKHFESIRHCAERMAVGQDIKSLRLPIDSLESKIIGFDQQLVKGLYAPLSQLVKNTAGWSYRNIPVVLYQRDGQLNRVHFSSTCDLLKNDCGWAWVSSSRQMTAHPDYRWCEYCLATQSLPKVQGQDGGLDFFEFVKRNSHYYFHTQGIHFWQEGAPITGLKKDPQERISFAYAMDENTELVPCKNCTWQIAKNSPYLLSGTEHPDLEEADYYCILCAQAHTEKVLILPEGLRWQALQQRCEYFNGVCQNWTHLRLHIDVSWHPLIDALQRKGIELPVPYHSLHQGHRVKLLAPLVWLSAKRAVVMDEENIEGVDDDWTVITYSQLLHSLN